MANGVIVHNFDIRAQKVLLVENESTLQSLLKKCLEKTGCRVEAASSADEALTMIKARSFDIVLLDVALPDMSVIETVSNIRAINQRVGIVLMTLHSAGGVALQTAGQSAEQSVLTSSSCRQMEIVIGNALENWRRWQSENSVQFVGKSEPVRRVMALVRKVATLDSTVLITGESGTGKELIADIIHKQSLRAGGPFVKINCAAIPEGLLEGEIFGHEKGAFTGAYSRRLGKFEMSQKGTILLDEIGDMPYGIQGKLLRLIEDKQVERLGGNVPRSVDTRVIAVTNQDLVELIRQKRFREDLYHRLNVLSLYIPPLRDRMADLPLLVDHLLKRINLKCGTSVSGISEEAMGVLLSYHRPGNVRELAHALERAAILSEFQMITAAEIRAALQRSFHRCDSNTSDLICVGEVNGGDLSLHETLQLIERNLIVRALEETRGRQSQAAKILGLSAKNLWKKIQKHSIDPRIFAGVQCNQQQADELSREADTHIIRQDGHFRKNYLWDAQKAMDLSTFRVL